MSTTRLWLRTVLMSLVALAGAGWVAAAGLTFDQLAALRTVNDVVLSPDGAYAAYTVTVPRTLGTGDDGPAWKELHVVSVENGVDRGFVTGKVNVGSIRFTPDGQLITYLATRGEDEHDALWAIPLRGGESRKLVEFSTPISAYEISPDGTRVAFVAQIPKAEARETAEGEGYDQEIFEEDWMPRKVWVAALPGFSPVVADPSAGVAVTSEPTEVLFEGSAWNVAWSPGGTDLAIDVAPRPLIDDKYMKRRLHIIRVESGETRAVVDNPGKLGSFDISQDGLRIAMISAADPNDPSAGRLMVSKGGGSLTDVLPGLEGGVSSFVWRNARVLMYVVDSGVETRLEEVHLDTGRQINYLVSGGPDDSRAPILHSIAVSEDGNTVVAVGDTPAHPSELFVFSVSDGSMRRLTDSNPWLSQVDLAAQEAYRWTAKDGLEIEGVLIHALNDGAGTPPPLILMVHGGPESHRRNGWLTRYSSPGQVAAAKGFAVLYPNYRGSTGRGVAFSKLGQRDAAGKEFDDLVDAVKSMAADGLVNSDRVGITGGSYGGYATAWCSTKYSEHFRAGVMFVGISNEISKGLTTEIPVEDTMVHTFYEPTSHMDMRLERSPIFHADKSRTAVLIAGGTADSRVNPAQSLQLYRALKLIGKTPVRYVRYPGEGHGNRRAAARDDYARRLIRWMEHFVKDKKTELPPWQMQYGLDFSGEPE